MVGRRSSSFVPVLVLVLMGGFLYLVLYPPETQRQEDTRDVSSPSKDNEVEEPKKRFHRTENNFERLCKCDANACEYGKIFDKSPESCCVCVAVDRSPNVFHISMVTTKACWKKNMIFFFSLFLFPVFPVFPVFFFFFGLNSLFQRSVCHYLVKRARLLLKCTENGPQKEWTGCMSLLSLDFAIQLKLLED
eukprot:m.107821 g.107821  ORF g.107821 m.107821 type:complete len:191 (+) comp9181_c0_seq6:51-623(+)